MLRGAVVSGDGAAPVVLGYARVSTDEQARSGLGIEAQRAAIDAWAAWRGRTVEHHDENGLSGMMPPAERPVLGPLLARLADPSDPADTLAVARLDRLGRSTIDVLALIEQAQAEGWHLVIREPEIDTTTPEGLAMATVLMAFARLERDMTARRTRDALAAKTAAGERLGRPVSAETRAAAERAAQLIAAGLTQAQAADALTAEGFPRATAAGGAWNQKAVSKALRTLRLDRAAAERAARPDGAEAS